MTRGGCHTWTSWELLNIWLLNVFGTKAAQLSQVIYGVWVVCCTSLKQACFHSGEHLTTLYLEEVPSQDTRQTFQNRFSLKMQKLWYRSACKWSQKIDLLLLIFLQIHTSLISKRSSKLLLLQDGRQLFENSVTILLLVRMCINSMARTSSSPISKKI